MNTTFKEQVNSYLTFKIEEEYGAHFKEVPDTFELQKNTRTPKLPDYMKGLISPKDMVLPVIGTGIKFNMPPT